MTVTLPVEYTRDAGTYRIVNRGNNSYPDQCTILRKEGDDWRALNWTADLDAAQRFVREFDAFVAPLLQEPKEMPEAFVVAANWWAEQLRQGGKKDNGEARQSLFCTVLVSMQEPPDVGNIAKFAQGLARYLAHLWIKHGKRTNDWREYLRVDYDPDWALRALALHCDISTMRFPWKTTMSVFPAHVVVRCGYRAAQEMIFGTPIEHDFAITNRRPYGQGYVETAFKCQRCGYITYGDTDKPLPESGWTVACKEAK